MVPPENLEESVVRTGRDFPAGGNPCLLKGLTGIQALHLREVLKMREIQFILFLSLGIVCAKV